MPRCTRGYRPSRPIARPLPCGPAGPAHSGPEDRCRRPPPCWTHTHLHTVPQRGDHTVGLLCGPGTHQWGQEMLTDGEMKPSFKFRSKTPVFWPTVPRVFPQARPRGHDKADPPDTPLLYLLTYWCAERHRGPRQNHRRHSEAPTARRRGEARRGRISRVF